MMNYDQSKNYAPTDMINGFAVRPGLYLSNGASVVDGGVNFTIHSYGATSCTLCLFHRTEKQPYAVIPFPESYRIGNTYSMIVYGLVPTEFEYAYQFDGEYDPQKGLLFDKKNYILDPYAKAVVGQSDWGRKSGKDPFYKARVVDDGYDWGNGKQKNRQVKDLIIYEMHVRGFTKDASSGVTHRGTFAGIKEKIPYLVELGVNAVELMPIFEFDEMEDVRVVDGKEL